uniref:F5/8 type C domain-containing protein n=1 Tax=Loa loa TaxID=7209 RepID=A0A1I7VPL5_LOALO
MCADCNPGVVRIQLGGSPDRGEVSQTRMFSVTSTTTRRIWLRMSFLNDFHLYALDNPIISLSYVTDCGSYRGVLVAEEFSGGCSC